MKRDVRQNPAERAALGTFTTRISEKPTPPVDAEVAYKLTENIPVGTYTIELDAAGQPFFSFCSTRWLRMLDLDREAVMADPAIAFKRVHPDDVEGFIALNAFVMRKQMPFFWRGRIVVGNETRWVVIESLPRELPLTSTKPGGSGLGLYMVRMVMENHAGTISMREAPGGGAAAVLTFPRITRST